MLNAREDHVEENYGFTYEEYAKKYGCTWITIQNEIAYLKEVHYNAKVIISSKIIELGDKISKVEILMKSSDGKIIHSVLWLTVIYFNMKTRKSEIMPEETKILFRKFLSKIEEKKFEKRIAALRKINVL
jgi:acyl-CoA thioester hydrolase